MAAYSSGGALKCARTASRARSTSSVDAAEAGFSECGFPKAAIGHSLGMRGQLSPGRQARTGVIEVDVPARVKVGVLGRSQPVKQRRAPVTGICGQEAGRRWR